MNQNISSIIGCAAIAFVAYYAYGLYGAHKTDVQRQKYGAAVDAKFCGQWRDYYVSFCESYPSHCAEGPEKLARCVQGWNK